MEKTFVLKYLLKQKDAFFTNYQAAVKEFDVEAIHDLRVGVKRINAILRMLNYDSKSNFRLKKCIKPVRFVYKKLGKIRDLQVLEELLIEYQDTLETDLSIVIKEFEDQRKCIIQNFYKDTKFFQTHATKRAFSIIEYYLSNKTKELLLEKVKLYKKKREDEFKIYSDPVNKDHDLHKTRRVIKDIGYLIEMTQNEIPEFTEELSRHKEIGRLLGNWHDRVILGNYINRLKKKEDFLDFDFHILLDEIYKNKGEMKNKFYTIKHL